MNSFTPELKKLLEKAAATSFGKAEAIMRFGRAQSPGFDLPSRPLCWTQPSQILTNDVFGDPSIRRRRTTAPK
jgi:hypothetical protein